MTKIDTCSKILDLDGVAVKETDQPNSKEATLRLIMVSGLLANNISEPNVNGVEKALRFTLAVKTSPGGCIDYKPEELVRIKTVIGLNYPPLIVGRAYEILDK